MKLYIRIALGAVIFLAVGGLFTALYLYNLKPRDLHKAKPHYSISAVDFQKAFDENEKAASSKYINKIIETNGEILSVSPGENNTLNVSLKTGNELSSIICTFHSVTDTSILRPGNQIILRGVCSGFLMDVLMNDCAIIQISRQ